MFRPILVVAAACLHASCSHVNSVRIQDESVHVGKGLRPIAAIQANVTSFYLLGIPMPGGVGLDRVVNRMLVVKAKTLGADKVIITDFDATPEGGIWMLRRVLGWASARAAGIAVQITELPEDPDKDDGPEPKSGDDPAKIAPPSPQPGDPAD